MRTQVAIIGGGPSGLLLALLLERQGIDCVVLERQTRDYVLSRVRAGLLEQGFLDLMAEAGVADRMREEGIRHDGVNIASDSEMFQIDFKALTGRQLTIYGQTEVTRDFYDAVDARGIDVRFQVEDVRLYSLEENRPSVTWMEAGVPKRLDCHVIAGCDGYHGISRQFMPEDKRHEWHRHYPFGWMGVLSETPPVNHELIYSRSDLGFALCSMRNPMLSRYYVQCSLQERVEDWSDDRFWDELCQRLPEAVAGRLVTGPSIEKSIAPLRSYVCEPMSYGTLFLCGDAAHIVPPTGAKGLNTAASDVHYLYRALRDHFIDGDGHGLKTYSETALTRVWKAERFSWWMTEMLHHFPDRDSMVERLQHAELAYLRDSKAAQTAFAENYVGLPY